MDINTFSFIPHCLTPDQVVKVSNLSECFKPNGTDVDNIIVYWTQWLFVIGAIVSFFYVVYGGFLMLTALGNEQKYTQAKSTVLYALIGFAISTLASLIVGAVTSFLRSGL